MIIRVCFLLAIFLITAERPAFGCTPVSVESVTSDKFYDPRFFGRLGIASRRDVFRIVDRVACFDATDFKSRGLLKLYFNHATEFIGHTNNPSYLAVQVVSAISSRRPVRLLTVYRNENDRAHPERGLWVHPRSKKLSEIDANTNSVSPESDLSIPNGSPYEPTEREAVNGDYELYTGAAAGQKTHDDFVGTFGTWHALLVSPNELRGSIDEQSRARTRQEPSYTIVHNTWQQRQIWDLPPDELKSLVSSGAVRLRQYMIHYRPFLKEGSSSPKPNHEVIIPIPTKDASCIYIRITGPDSFGTYYSIKQYSPYRFIALRLDPSATCTAPPTPEGPMASLFSLFFGGPASAATRNSQ